MNKQLKEKTKALVMKYHAHFAMRTWLEGFYSDDIVDAEAMEKGCGTTGCMAVWVCIAAGEKLEGGEMVDSEPRMHVEYKAKQLLGVSTTRVFYDTQWPNVLFEEYHDARENGDTIGMARVACEALDYFGGLDD